MNNLKKRLNDLGFELNNFNEDYQNCIDNYNFEYNCLDAESHNDFENYCFDNWS